MFGMVVLMWWMSVVDIIWIDLELVKLGKWESLDGNLVLLWYWCIDIDVLKLMYWNWLFVVV